jgi:hypothetical protein
VKHWLVILLFHSFGSSAPAMTMEEAWRALGLRPGASADDIKRAHHALVKKLHPDTNGGDKAAEDLLKEVNVAKDVLLGKRAPTSGPGSAGPKSGRGNFRDFDFDDFTAEAQKPRPNYRPPEDAFVRRFFLQNETELQPPLKKALEDYVRLAEKLFAGKMTGELVQLQNSVEETTGHAGLARKIFFTLVGEHVQRYPARKQADETLKAYLLSKRGPGLERALDDFVAYNGSTRLKGPHGKWANLFPESTRAILSHPGLKLLSPDTQRVLFTAFLQEAEDPAAAAFYREAERSSPLLRGRRVERQVRKLFEGNQQPKPTAAELRRRAQEILDELRRDGSELDLARVRIYESLMNPALDPRSYPEFLDEIRKIQDYSGFSLTRGLSVAVFTGEPEVIAARKALLQDVLLNLRAKAPSRFAEERAAFPKRFEQWGTKGWEPVIEFVTPLLAEGPAPAAPTAEYRLQAEQCAKEYARISRVIGGVK